MVRKSSKWGKFWFKVKFDLEGQGQSPKVFYNFGPNLEILAWTGPTYRADKQVIDIHTHTGTHTVKSNAMQKHV